jgi:hypothetical protein
MVNAFSSYESPTVFALVVACPHLYEKSNGIGLVLGIAKAAISAGRRVVVVPGQSLNPECRSGVDQINNIPLAWRTPEGCCAIVCDTVSAERLTEVRQRAASVCHYALAPRGIFQFQQGKLFRIHPGEKSAVYSSAVSIVGNCHYLQAAFPEIERTLKGSSFAAPLAKFASFGQTRGLDVVVYAGKGRLSPLMDENFSAKINPLSIKCITRQWPSRKGELYRLLAKSDLLISYDPISSLIHESILLGTPVLVVPPWDEDFAPRFPICLDGVAWNSDYSKALKLLETGYDWRGVYDSYLGRRKSFGADVLRLLDYAEFSPALSDADAADENSYWASRQYFFKALSLPSFYADEVQPGAKILSDSRPSVRILKLATFAWWNFVSLAKIPIRLAFFVKAKLFSPLLWPSKFSCKT